MTQRGISMVRRDGGGLLNTTHGEAFCLMRYQNRTTGRLEWLWNSRDGVVPFVISDPLAPEEVVASYKRRLRAGAVDHKTETSPTEMGHVEWQDDAFCPNFVPPLGMRIFMSWGDAPPDYRSVMRDEWHHRINEGAQGERLSASEKAELRAKTPFGLEAHSPCVITTTPELVTHFGQLCLNPYIPASPGIIQPEKPRVLRP